MLRVSLLRAVAWWGRPAERSHTHDPCDPNWSLSSKFNMR